MRTSILRLGGAALLAAVLAGCGGGGGSSTPKPPEPPPPTATLAEKITAAAADAANDSATNSSAPFSVLQGLGVPAVTVKSPPVVHFAVFSDGAVVKDLKDTGSARLTIAKLIPPADGNPHRWESYISTKVTANPSVGPGGTAAILTPVVQATAESNGDLAYNDDGYYTYTFKTDIKDLVQTNGVAFDATKTHRVAIQLSYKNKAGTTVLVNPYFDFAFDADGNSVPVTDPALTFKMTDVSSCNSCHEKLALHGGGRVDTQFCVMCHNPGTTDPNSGNVLTLSTMAHKIHSGRLLDEALKEGKGGEDYTIWGYRDSKHEYAEVGFPQDLRNCTKCHSGDNPKTPQGDNWKTAVSKEACLTCHANKAGSDWDASHALYASTLVGPGAKATDMSNKQCNDCHKAGTNIGSDRVHFNQVEVNAAKYKMNIESVTLAQSPSTTQEGLVEVKYYLSDPTNGDTKYKLEDDPDKFGSLYLYVMYQSLSNQVGSPVTEYTSYNNGGNRVRVTAISGTNDGNNVYTNTITIPMNTATSVASGTARVVTIGQIKEPKLVAKWATDPRPEVVGADRVNTLAQNTFKEFPITGTLNPRRVVVANEKCNACHGALGATSGSNTLANAFHSGARNTVEACVMCHDPNRMSSTIMTNGLDLNESYQFKRMIHGIHGNSRRTYPFTHGNKVVDAFNKDGTSMTEGNPPLADDVENYAAEVAWPGVGINCNVCHVDGSYKLDRGTVGSVVKKPDTAGTDPLQWLVISPKAASCTACHDSPKAIGHVTSFGNASFASRSQADSMDTQETCTDCHASGGFKGVDIVHGQN